MFFFLIFVFLIVCKRERVCAQKYRYLGAQKRVPESRELEYRYLMWLLVTELGFP